MYYVFSIKKHVKKFWPFLFILAIWFVFSYPYFVQGRIPYSSTYQVNNFAPWDAYPGFASPVKNGAMPDVTTQIIPWKHFTIETYKMGQIPLWNPNSFSGTPHLANYQSAVLSPFNLLFFILPFVDGWSMLVLLQPLLAGIFMYLFSRSLKVSVLGSLISSVSFMFCGFIVVWMDYATLAYAALFLPLALFAIEKFYESKKVIFLILLSMTLPLSFFSGHFAISIYFLLTVLGFIVYKFFSSKDSATSLLCFLYCFFGILFILPQVLPTVELYSQSLRSQLFQKIEVIPWMYLPTFIAPDFFGNPVTRNDWFGHYAEWNGYIGLLPLFFAFFALKIKQGRIWFFALLAIISVLCAFPTPLLDAIVFLRIPVFSTSAASRAIIIFIFAFAVLAGIGFDRFYADLKQRKVAFIRLFLGISAILFVALWCIIFFKLFLPTDKILIAKQNIILPTIVFLGFAVLTFGFSIFKNLQKRNALLIFGAVVLLLVSFDSLRFAVKWQAFDPKRLFFPDVPITNYFKKISDNQKVIGNFGAEASVYYNLPSLEGYDALYNNRYGEFIASLLTQKVSQSPRSVVIFPKTAKLALPAINLLNGSYIVHKSSDDFTSWTFPYWQNPGQFSLLYSDNAYRVYKNTKALPHAFFVSSYVIESDPQKIIDTLFAKTFDFSKRIVLEKSPGIISNTVTSESSVTIQKYTPNVIELSENSNVVNGFIFLSNPFFPGWEAFVNNKKTDIVRADFAFQAIKVEKGKNLVRLIYNPLSFKLGLYGALFGLLLLIFSSVFLPRSKFFPKS